MAGDPLWINVNAGAPSYSANELRQAMALALMYDGRNMGGRKGVRPGGNQLQVSYAAPTITVQPGLCYLDPALSTPQGGYWVAIPAAETFTLTPADATNPRKDIVIARVYDHDEDASGLRLARTEYLVGTPNPSPSEPAVPAGAIKLALLDVPASPGAVVVTDRRPWTVAAGGVLPVADSTAEAALSPYDGLVIARLDLPSIRARLAGAWYTLMRGDANGVSLYQPVITTENTDLTGITGTSPVAGAPSCGLSFTMPPSGKAYVTVTGWIQQSTSGQKTFLGWEFRAGSTIGSGAVQTGADAQRALVVGGTGTADEASSWRTLIAATPGSMYNVQTMHWVTGGTGAVFARQIMVEPVH